MALDKAKIVEELSNATVIEIADLVKELESKWGVSAAAPVAVAAAAGAAPAPAAEAPPAAAPVAETPAAPAAAAPAPEAPPAKKPAKKKPDIPRTSFSGHQPQATGDGVTLEP